MNQPQLAVATIGGTLCAGVIDHVTGIELRVYPLYFLPVAVAARSGGMRMGILLSVLATATWLVSNYSAGLQFTADWIWFGNVATQSVSFVLVAVLIARLRDSLAREHAQGRADALTGLLNSRAFYEQAEQVLALCRRNGTPVTLAYLDLDNFKCVNDTRGHSGGDEVLRTFASLLAGKFRASDLVARVGGDEFVVLLPDTGPDGAAAVLERVRLDTVSQLAYASCSVSASIGAVSFVQAPASLEELIHAADEVMYAAKRAGKNRLQLESRMVPMAPLAPVMT